MKSFAEAAAQAALEFYKQGDEPIVYGMYLSIEPDLRPGSVVDGTVEEGWGAAAGKPLAANLVTDMYGPHRTVVGVIYVDDGGGFEVLWQDM